MKKNSQGAAARRFGEKHAPPPGGAWSEPRSAGHECGINRTYLSGVERSERNVSIDNVARIARELKAWTLLDNTVNATFDMLRRALRRHVTVMPSAAHSKLVSIREMLRLRCSEIRLYIVQGWKSRRLVLVVTLKVPGMWEFPIGLFARGARNRRRAVAAAARSFGCDYHDRAVGWRGRMGRLHAGGRNVTATCTGATTNQGGGLPGSTTGNDGYGTGVETGVTVNVVGGASNTISGNTNGIFLGDATVTNCAGASIAGGVNGINAVNGCWTVDAALPTLPIPAASLGPTMRAFWPPSTRR